jgi:hypothetical protein
VDRARPDDDDQPFVAPVQDARDLVAPAGDRLRAVVAEGELLEEDRRRNERSEALDPQVAGPVDGRAQSETPFKTGTAPGRPGTRAFLMIEASARPGKSCGCLRRRIE